MWRWLRSILSIISMLIFLIGAAIWIRSYFATADLEWFSRYTDSKPTPVTHTLGIGIGWGPGMIELFHYRGESSTPRETARTWIYREFAPNRKLTTAASPDDVLNWRVGTLQALYRVERQSDGWMSVRLLVFPAWLALVAAIPPGMWWVRHRRSRRNAEVAQEARAAPP